jgi:uncharacterized protein involved in exopolysaccharide biosynthesis
MPMRDMFDPISTYKNLLERWWVIVIAAFIGGLLAYGLSFLMPEKYQAEAIFNASIDFTEVNFENLQNENGDPLTFTQYDEDLALQVVQRMLLATKNDAFQYAQSLDPGLDIGTFNNNYQIRRYHALWYLRYRHQDPQIAQSIVNFWAERGWEALQEAQQGGRAEEFVILDLVSLSALPQAPIYQNRNNLILAGTMIGFITGVILVDFTIRYDMKSKRIS